MKRVEFHRLDSRFLVIRGSVLSLALPEILKTNPGCKPSWFRRCILKSPALAGKIFGFGWGGCKGSFGGQTCNFCLVWSINVVYVIQG